MGRLIPGLGKRDITVPEGLFADENGDPATLMKWSPLELLALPIAFAVVYLDWQAAHTNYTLNNGIATMIAADLLALISLRSFKVRCCTALQSHVDYVTAALCWQCVMDDCVITTHASRSLCRTL